MKEITKAQEEILRILWEIREGAVSDVLEAISGPKPAYNTVSTVIKVLEKKGYVTHKKFGKTYVYYPLVSKSDYSNQIIGNAFTGLFNGSLSQLVSHFVKEKKADLNELEELKTMVEKEIDKLQ